MYCFQNSRNSRISASLEGVWAVLPRRRFDSVCAGTGVWFGSSDPSALSASLEKKGAPSFEMPAKALGSSRDMRPKADENPPS